MTVLLERPAPSVTAATRALAGAEARRLWHSPLYWGGVVLSIALGVAWSWTRMPTWETFDQNAGMSSLVLAAVLLMATHLAAGRDRRAGAEETTRTMPAAAARRGFALLVTVPIAGLTGAAVYLAELLLLLPAWPVGRADLWAAGVVVLIPAIGAAAGVAVGRVLPGAAAGPLVVAGLAALLLSLIVLPSDPRDYPQALWPVPDVPWEVGAARPTGWHFLYLLGVLVAVIAGGLASGGLAGGGVASGGVAGGRGNRGLVAARPILAALLAISGVALSGFAVQHQVAAMPSVYYIEDADALTSPAVLDCQSHRNVRYCALPGYAPWTAYWREAVEPVADRLPADAARPVVRQIGGMDTMEPMSPGQPEVITTTVWGRTGHWAAHSRLKMAGDYAVASLQLIRRDVMMTESCDGVGQHRTVAALWLVGQTGADDVRRRLESGDVRLPMVRYGPDELRAALHLLDQPRDEVAEHITGHWTELLDPAGTALSGLGVTLTPHPGAEACR